MFKHILIPTDGSDLSAKAVRAGIEFAKEVGAQVTAYYAFEPIPTRAYGEGYMIGSKDAAEYERRAKDVGERHLDRFARMAKAAGVSFQPLVAKADSPYEGIVDTARRKKCDVIFMASHGRRGLAGVLIGSITQKVLTHSKVPVLVYR